MIADEPAAVSTPMLEPDEFLALVADAYRDAALAGADMKLVAEALETIRSRTEGAASPFPAWDAIDDQIGRAEDERLRDVLVAVRDRFVEGIRPRIVERVVRAFEHDPETGWALWVRAYADALTNWRMELCSSLVEPELALPPGAPSIEDLRRVTRYAIHDRWPEVHEFLLVLARDERVPSDQRGELLTYGAQTHLYFLVKPADALRLLEEAEHVAPEQPTVVFGRGEYWLQLGELDRARESIQRGMAAATPGEGYALMGDTYERQNDLEAAEEWYRATIETKPGESEGYRRMVRLIGRPELLESRESELVPLLDKAALVDPQGRFAAYLDVGYAYQQNGRHEDAERWYERAVALDPTRLDGYTNKGYDAMAATDLAAARAAFQKAIDVAPEAFDGYWGMGLVAEQAAEPEEALEWFKQSMPLRPSWEATVRGRRGEILRSLERYAEAETELLAALRLEPEAESILSSLHDLADAYTSTERIADSLRILEEVRAIKGEAYEDAFQNRVGNVLFYSQEYESAIEAYQKAVDLHPYPVYLANLAGAWAQVRRPGRRPEELANAISALRRAVEADPTNREYSEDLAAVELEGRALAMFGENIVELSPATLSSLQVDVTPDVLPLILAQSGELSEETLDLISAMQERFRQDYGVVVPGVQFDTLDDPSLLSGYVVSLVGSRLSAQLLPIEKRFAPGGSEPLVTAGVAAERHSQSLDGYWVEREDWQTVSATGLPLWTPVEYMLRHVESMVQAHLEELVGHQDVVGVLGEVEGGDAITESTTTLTAFVTGLKALLREGVSIAPLGAIGARFRELEQEGSDLITIVESLRSLPELRDRLPGNDDRTMLFEFDPAFEAEVRHAMRGAADEAVLALRRDRRDDVMRAVRRAVRLRGPVALIVGDAALRPFVRSLLEAEFPRLHVLSRAELLPGLEDRSEPPIEVPGVPMSAEAVRDRGSQ